MLAQRTATTVAAAFVTMTLALTATLAVGSPASADDAASAGDTGSSEGVAPLVAPVLGAPVSGRVNARAASSRRPLFAFWGQKYNLVDGFSFQTAVRGSGTSIEMTAQWKTYRGVKPIMPRKVVAQMRVDGGGWSSVPGVKGTVTKGLVRARMPAYVVAAGVPAQTVDYRLKTKASKKGPKKARRSVRSTPVSVRFENQAMYTGEQARFYAPIANLCPSASVTLDLDGTIADKRDAVFSWQYGVTIDPAEINAITWESEASKMAVAIHECAHARQFYNWGGTRSGWLEQEKAAAAVFVADDNPSGPTPPMEPDWAPVEHAADCATFLATAGAERTYGGYCNPGENAAAGLLWQGQRY
jgi:hypothetical protein